MNWKAIAAGLGVAQLTSFVIGAYLYGKHQSDIGRLIETVEEGNETIESASEVLGLCIDLVNFMQDAADNDMDEEQYAEEIRVRTNFINMVIETRMPD